jgi:hypothetical protein
MSTIFGSSAIIAELGGTTITPDMEASIEFADADDELREICNFITEHSPYNENIDPERLKFLYTTSSKKEGGRYVIGSVIARSEMEKVIDDSFDYIICLYQPVWKDLDSVNKVIQLDKLMCGINIDEKEDGTVKYRKNTYDSREFTDNMRFFGAEKVMNSTDLVHQAATQVEELMKQAKKAAKNAVNANGFDQFMENEE